MKLTRANAKAIKYACMKFHYAKAVPVNTLGYNVYNDAGEWCGVVVFGTGATPNMARPYGLSQGEVLELVRVALNGKQESTSKAVGIALRLLKKDCPIWFWSQSANEISNHTKPKKYGNFLSHKTGNFTWCPYRGWV